jgi:hypothetical protein
MGLRLPQLRTENSRKRPSFLCHPGQGRDNCGTGLNNQVTKQEEKQPVKIKTKRRLPGKRDMSNASAAFIWGYVRLWEGGEFLPQK